MAQTIVQPVICPVLVGRSAYLETLHHLIEQVNNEDRGFGTAVISGEAGIGKSRLADEVKGYAVRRGFHVLHGNCFEPDQALPYAPLLDLLRLFCVAHSPAEIAQELGPVAPELVPLLPELAVWLPDLVPTSTAFDPEQEKHRLFQALTQFFSRLASRQPHLLIFEDLHWSDDTSLEFLLHLARRLRSLPIILLLTYRNDERSPALDQFRVELARRRLATELALSPLSLDEVQQMISAIFDLLQPVHSDFRDTLYTLTEGNPFFLEEILRALMAGGEIFYTDGRWERKSVGDLHIPPTIQVAVQRRLQQLSQAARKALVLAAVAGRRFDFSLLQALLQQETAHLPVEIATNDGQDAPGAGQQELLGLIKEMMAAHLVVEESAEQFAFRHALTRQAIMTGLLVRERQALHGLVAETIEHLYADAPDGHLADLATHYYEAGTWQKALAYARKAGERALALYTPRAAVTQFTRALEAARRLHLPPDAGLYRTRGQAYETLGELPAAQADYEAALQAARHTNERQGEWQALLDLGLLWSARDYQLAGDYSQQALALARRLEEPATVAHTLNRLGNWHLNRGRPWQAIEHHRESLAIFEAEGDERGLAETLDLLGMSWIFANDLAEARACYQRALDLFRRLDHRQGLITSLVSMNVCAGHCYVDTVPPAAPLPETIAQGEMAWQMAQELGWPAGEAFAKLELTGCLITQGEYGRALELANSALEIAGEINHFQWQAGSHCALGALYLELYAPAAATRHLDQAIDIARQLGSVPWLGIAAGFRLRLHLLQQEFAEAETFLEQLLSAGAPVEAIATAGTFDRQLWAAAAELAVAQTRPQEALEIVAALYATLPAAGEQGTLVRLAQIRAEALVILNQFEAAEESFLAAHQVASEQGHRNRLWRIDAALGRLYRHQRRYEAAQAHLAAAQDQIETLAATIPTGNGDGALREQFRQGALATLPDISPPTPLQAAKQKFGGLTRREREVASLVAQGLSNRDIAEKLVLSERTVEKHVSNILSKLHFTSRTQVAAWAVPKGLVGK
jgi:DNA-binding CsgD family transcriptional regulator